MDKQASHRRGPTDDIKCSLNVDDVCLILIENFRRLKIRQNLESYIRHTKLYTATSTDQFALIQEWYHFAILEALTIDHLIADVPSLSQFFNISSKVVQDALDRLLRLGFLEKSKDGKSFNISAPSRAVSSKTPNHAIRLFHKQILKKAQEAVDNVAMERRTLNSLMMAIPANKMQDLRQKILDFLDDIEVDAKESPPKEDVYCLAVQLFPLSNI